jgi:hypothetical protein
MNNFRITVDGRKLNVHPQTGSTFKIYEWDDLLCELDASSKHEDGFYWNNQCENEEDANHVFDELIGKAIGEYKSEE